MNNKAKFDGPSFVNPSHTSYGNNSSGYQTPQMNFNPNNSNSALNKNLSTNNTNTSTSSIKKGPKGWEDEVSSPAKISTINTRNDLSKKNDVQFMKSNYKNSVKTEENINTSKINQESNGHDSTYVNYWDADCTRKIQASTLSIDHETKLIDSILNPTGVTTKPSENQLKEFLKRLKSLKKEIVLDILFQKIRSTLQPNDNNQTKILIKGLYVIISIINEKIEGFLQYFVENEILFQEIKSQYTNNKKVCELVDEVIGLISGGTVLIVKTPIHNKSEKALIYIDETNTNTNTSESISKSKSSNNEFNNIIQDVNINKNKDSNSILKENKAKFNFIKKKNNEEIDIDLKSKSQDLFDNLSKKPQDLEKENDTPAKFSFIKSKKTEINNSDLTCNTNTSINNLTNELNKVFDYKIDFTGTYNINECQNKINTFPKITQEPHENMNNINKQISTTGSRLNNNNTIDYLPERKHYPANFDMLFNPDLLNNGPSLLEKNVEIDGSTSLSQGKQNNKKDHFDFVNDLMKPKK